MTTLSLLMLQMSLLASDGRSYADAYKHTVSTGQPLVILVGAEWCPGCEKMKNSVIPQLERRGALERVSFAYVNADRERDLAGKLVQGTSIPQLIVYRKTAKGWTRQQMTGMQSVTETEGFLSRAQDNSPTELTSR